MGRESARFAACSIFARELCLLIGTIGASIVPAMGGAVPDDTIVVEAPAIPSGNSHAYSWNGFYSVARPGLAWASSIWTADISPPAVAARGRSSLPLPVKAARAPSAYDWSGFYVGGNLGGAWFQNGVTELPDEQRREGWRCQTAALTAIEGGNDHGIRR